MDNDIKKLKKYIVFSLIAVVLVVFLCPFLIRWILSGLRRECIPRIDLSVIMAFSGSVIGGGIGGITALIAIFFTLKYYTRKDELLRSEGVYNRQVERINSIVQMINKREIIPYDNVNTFRLDETLLRKISDYNDLTSNLKGFYTKYAVGLLQAFQAEYDYDPKSGLDEEKRRVDHSISVIGFLNLKKEVRECAERIGKLALYENATELLHGDPWISFMLELEAGGSAGLWASGLHDKSYAFDNDDYHYEMLVKYFPLVDSLLIGLESFKETEYDRIVRHKDESIAPKSKIKREYNDGTFMHGEKITVERSNTK